MCWKQESATADIDMGKATKFGIIMNLSKLLLKQL